MVKAVSVPRIDGLTDWYYLEGNQVRQVVKIGYRIKLERVFAFESEDESAEYFAARERDKQELFKRW